MTPVPEIRHILVPHDFSDTADRALEWAIALAGKLGAHLTLLHVYEVPAMAYPETLAVSPEYAAEGERIIRDRLAALAARAKQSHADLQTLLRVGTAWSEIAKVAELAQVDLIVMGTHGRRGVSRVLLGSVAEKVVRTAHCAVLTIPLAHGRATTGAAAAH